MKTVRLILPLPKPPDFVPGFRSDTRPCGWVRLPEVDGIAVLDVLFVLEKWNTLRSVNPWSKYKPARSA